MRLRRSVSSLTRERALSDLTRHTIFFDDNLWPASVGDARGICDVRSLACLDAPLHYDDANGLWFHHVVRIVCVLLFLAKKLNLCLGASAHVC